MVASYALDARKVRLDSLPPFPLAILRLLHMIDDDRESTRALAAVIRTDPSLTANLLRLAHSAMFGSGRSIARPEDAIVRLGTKRVADLTTGLWLRTTIPAELPFYGEGADTFWRHSLASAVLTDELLAAAGARDPAGFAAGLLHDIGKLAIAFSFVGEPSCALIGEGDTVVAAERRLLGTDHAAVGGELAQRWNLPPEITGATRQHEGGCAGDTPLVAAAVQLASRMADGFELGNDDAALARALDSAAAVRLGLAPATVSRTEARARQLFDALLSSMTPALAG